MLHQVNTKRSLEEIDSALRDSAARHQFGVITVHDLQDTLSKKGVSLDLQCKVYEVCNPVQAKKVLETDGAISTALPCRISVYGSPEGYTLATLLPTEMMKGYGRPEIETVAKEVEAVIVQMMSDAAKE